MTARDYPVFTVTPKAERSLKAGHPWVYGEEVTAVEGVYQNGDMVDVVSSKGRYLGSGWVNDHSKIRVRVISRNANDTFDEAFFRRRVRYALDYRKTVMGPIDYRCCRLIFGEADQFPGLTVDRFENVLVTQVLSLGMERRKDMVYRALVELLREDGEIACLIKPQFEAGREKVGKKGVVRDPKVHLEVLEGFLVHAKENNFTVLGITYSPIRGPEGNIEYLGYLKKNGGADCIPDLRALVDASHSDLKEAHGEA